MQNQTPSRSVPDAKPTGCEFILQPTTPVLDEKSAAHTFFFFSEFFEPKQFIFVRKGVLINENIESLAIQQGAGRQIAVKIDFWK